MFVRGGYVRALSEAVSVQLTDEGANVVVLEIGWQNVLRKCVWVADDKRVALRRPADGPLSRFITHNLKKLCEEGRHVRTDGLSAVLHGATAPSTLQTVSGCKGQGGTVDDFQALF